MSHVLLNLVIAFLVYVQGVKSNNVIDDLVETDLVSVSYQLMKLLIALKKKELILLGFITYQR